jgi:signal transduction histidine kinase
MGLFRRFAQQPCAWIFAEMMVCLMVIGILDFITSYKIRLLPFYAGPIFTVAWFCGKRRGIPTALIAGVLWWWCNWFSGDPDLRAWIWIWETGRHFGFFLVVAWVGSALRKKDDMATARIALLEHSQKLEHEIVHISDAEQRRIGQDLHDGLCQYLAALTCSASSLRDDLEKSKMQAEANTAGELATLLQDAVVQTRDLARGLVPAHVSQVGLVVALESLAQSVARLHGIDCTFRLNGRPVDCDEDVAMHLYRIAQEAINNATRHGKAQKIAISLDVGNDLMTMRIADRGSGLSDTGSDGMGLALMRYRARLCGGDLTIEQPENGGTAIVCTAPACPPKNSETAAA